MNVVEVIQAVRSAGGSVTAAAGSLIVDAPPELPAVVWDALAFHKATLIELLAPAVTYADSSADEEREAIQAEPQAQAEAVAFDLPRPAPRCRLVRDVRARDPRHGFVTIPAGVEGWIVGIDEIGDGLERINLDWNMSLSRRDGLDPVLVSIDGRARVLDRSSVVTEEGESR